MRGDGCRRRRQSTDTAREGYSIYSVNTNAMGTGDLEGNCAGGRELSVWEADRGLGGDMYRYSIDQDETAALPSLRIGVLLGQMRPLDNSGPYDPSSGPGHSS